MTTSTDRYLPRLYTISVYIILPRICLVPVPAVSISSRHFQSTLSAFAFPAYSLDHLDRRPLASNWIQRVFATLVVHDLANGRCVYVSCIVVLCMAFACVGCLRCVTRMCRSSLTHACSAVLLWRAPFRLPQAISDARIADASWPTACLPSQVASAVGAAQ